MSDAAEPERDEADPARFDDAGEPVVIAHFHTLQLAHLAAARLEAEGMAAMVEPSNVTRGYYASFAAQPLGVGVMVPASQAEAAYGYLRDADLLPKPDTSAPRLMLQTRDVMWAAVATLPMFVLAPIAYAWASSTRRQLDRVREEMSPEDYLLARRRTTKARWISLIGVAFFLALAAFFLSPMLFN